MRPVEGSSSDRAERSRRLRTPLMLGCVVLALALSSRGFGDETYVSLQGDMPRHLMNGVFFMDAVRDWPFGSIGEAAEYARHYYARYPALSIGHHPFLIALAEAPVFALLGVSVTSGRLVAMAFFVIGVVYMYKLVAELFDEWAGAAAAAVFASSAYLVELAQGVMTETPALSLLVASAYYCHRFTVTQRPGTIYAATLLAASSAWAKQLAVLALPGLVLYVWWQLGWRRLLRKDVIGAALLSAALVAPLVPITLFLSPFNVAMATGFARSAGESGRPQLVMRAFGDSIAQQFAVPVFIAAVVGLLLLLARRHPAGWLAAGWIGSISVFLALIAVAQESARYSIYWVPAWALCVGALSSRRIGSHSVVVGVLVFTAIALQVAMASRVVLAGASGYEQAAQFVVENPRGSTVMFSGDVDTGFFSFFVRKHDSARQAIVLRADKLLTTSFMGTVSVEDRISDPSQIHELVRRFGIGYVVVEDRPSASTVQNWLLDDLKTARYVERLRLPSHSIDVRLRNKSLVVYEVVDAVTAAPDARLEIRLPLVSQEIDIPLSDLTGRKYLR